MTTPSKPPAAGAPAHKASSAGPAGEYRIAPNSAWASAWKIVGAIGVAGLLIAAYGWKTDEVRFAYSYLFGYYVALSLALGSLFFVLVLYQVKASWGVTVRRVAELFMRPFGLYLIVLAIPLVFLLPDLFPWMGTKHAQADASAEVAGHHPGQHEKGAHEQGAHEATASPLAESRGLGEREPVGLRDLPAFDAKRMEHAEEGAEGKIVLHKRFFLNPKFFLLRLIVYLAVWSWLSFRYFRWSSEQDETKSAANTAAAQRFAPAALILFAITITFWAFDWLLSLDATWYSTIFGVYVFAQVALFQMAALILILVVMRRGGLLVEAVNVEHYHDMGKLLFGWVVFWSYIAFAQFFLTWYSNIPDEVGWFHKRWHDNGGTWQSTSLLIVGMHFFVPFWFLMSRNIKRKIPLLTAGAVCMVVMHVIEAYWIILPNYGPLAPNLTDLGCLVGVFGVYLAAVLRGMVDHSLVPVGDPRLTRALDFENA